MTYSQPIHLPIIPLQPITNLTRPSHQMKLCLDDDEESRPEALTLSFFSGLMISEAKKKGVFQLLNVKRKREMVYSTKISDGFFEVKVMMVQDAARQLERGEVKELSVVEGWMRNHGEGVVVVKEGMRFWACSRVVGHPLPWRLKKENVNGNGLCFILWDSQAILALHAENKLGSYQKQAGTSQQKDARKGGSIRKEECQQQQQQQQLPKRETASLGGLTETQSITMGNSPRNKTDVLAKPVEKDILPNLQETQQLQVANKLAQFNLGNQEKTGNSLSTRMENILSFLFDSDDEEEAKLETKSVAVFPFRLPASQLSTHSLASVKTAPAIDLQLIFDCLNQDEEESREQRSGEKLKKSGKTASISKQEKEIMKSACKKKDESDDDLVFMQWLQQKREKKQQNPKITSPMRRSVNKRRQEMYNSLMSSPDSEAEAEDAPQIQQQLSFAEIDLTAEHPQLSGLLQLNFQHIYNGVFPKSSSSWWTTAIVRCLGDPNDKDYVNTILASQSNQYIINAVLTHFSQLQPPLQEGRLYRVGRGTIKSNLEHARWNCSHTEFEFDCRKALFEEVELEVEGQTGFAKEDSGNYQLIDRVYERDDGEAVNVFGVLKTVKNINGKNGVISNYEIVNPVIKYSIVLTQFQSQLPSEALPALVNTAVTVYNATVSSYKGRKNIVTKPKTIIKHHWLPLSVEADLVREWLEAKGSHVDDVELNLLGFADCPSLKCLMVMGDSQALVHDVTVLDLSPRYTYLACVKCLKKVVDGRCRTCGKRGNHEITERLFVRGNIGDRSTVVGVVWSNSIVQPILSEGFVSFSQKWVLQKVSVWLEKGANDNLTIAKIANMEIQTRISNLFAFIKERTL